MRRASRVCFVSSYRRKVEVICMLHFSVTFRLLFLVFKLFLLAFKKYYVPPTFISKIIISAASKGSVTPILRPASRTGYRKNARLSGRTKKKIEKKIYHPTSHWFNISLPAGRKFGRYYH